MFAQYATKYPKLFDCYWGAFDLRNCPEITPGIINNRNLFVENFHIKRSSDYRALSPFYGHEHSDHPETYTCSNGNIIQICSNYGTKPPVRFNMKPYAPLYTTAAQTFIRIFNGLADMRLKMKGK